MWNDSYDIYVGTEPMADRLNDVANKVDLTTAAVAGMETAVIAQERSSAQQICNKLDVGFFNVVMSQIAQKMARESAQGRALAMELMQQQKALQSLQSRMTGDYNMISSRYAKLFESLNQELRNRIAELDKPLIDFCSLDISQLQNRILSLVSDVPVMQAENVAASQSIAAAHVKSNASRLISSAGNYITGMREAEQKSLQVKVPDYQAATPTVDGQSTESLCYAPVIVDVEDTDVTRSCTSVKENPKLQAAMGGNSYRQAIESIGARTSQLPWKNDGQQTAIVTREFLGMVNQSTLPQRVKDEILRLFNRQFMTL